MTFDGLTTLLTGPRNETIDLSSDSQSLAWAALANVFRLQSYRSMFYAKELFFRIFWTSQKAVVVVREFPASVAASD
jgi:hypothetical protein